jgi:hypothetical protein
MKVTNSNTTITLNEKTTKMMNEYLKESSNEVGWENYDQLIRGMIKLCKECGF